MAENDGRYLDNIEVSHEIPDVILGGKPGEKKFQVFYRVVLETFMNNLLAARKNGVAITGIAGSVIIHQDIVGRKILLIVIDDVPRNLNFSKGNDDHIDSDQVILTDDFILTEQMKVTLIFE